MAAPRRAAAEDDATLEDLGTITPARRALGSSPVTRGRLTRMVLAPIAVLSVAGLAAGLVFLPPRDPGTTEAGNAAAHTAPLGTSRSFARPALTLPPSATPSVPSTSPSASAPEVTESNEPAVEAPAPAVSSAPATGQASGVSGEAVTGQVAGIAESATPKPVASATPTAEAPASPAAEPVTAQAQSAEPTVEETAEAEPEIDYTELAEAAGTLYTTASVNVRTGPSTGHDVRTTVREGAEVAVTELEVDGWRQVALNEKAGWVKASYLTETKPAVTESSGFSTASCAKASGLERNLTDRTAKVLRAVCAEFPRVSSYGGYRPGSGSYHGSGRAIDVMVSGDYGRQIAKWARTNAGALGIVEVIYEQKIWTAQRSGDGWRPMSNRGSASANHSDHVHISVR